MKTFPTPHDALFRKLFSDVGVARDFLQIHLPPALREICNFGTLTVTSGSFVEDNLRAQCSDMLYGLHTTAGPGYIYCLIEHQSSADEMMAFRLLRYGIAAMHRHLEQGNKKLPLVIPLLFYHGAQSPYPYSTRWLDCFHDPALAQALYNRAFPLVDVTVIPDEEIKTHRKVALLEYVQKHIRARDINLRIQDLAALLQLAQLSKEQVVSLLRYLAQVANTLDSQAFFRILGANTTCYKEEIMTIAEHLKQEAHKIGHQMGRQEGLQEGLREGRRARDREIARNLLSTGLDRAAVSHATGLSNAELNTLAE